MKRFFLAALCLSITGLASFAQAFGERQWYSCECQAAQTCVLGSKIEAGLSKDKETGKVTDYAVALKIASQEEDLGVWDPTYFADDIRFDHKINGFDRQGSLNLVLETDFAKKSAPVLKAQKQSQTNDYQCRKI